jgi:hypothetical protein
VRAELDSGLLRQEFVQLVRLGLLQQCDCAVTDQSARNPLSRHASSACGCGQPQASAWCPSCRVDRSGVISVAARAGDEDGYGRQHVMGVGGLVRARASAIAEVLGRPFIDANDLHQ